MTRKSKYKYIIVTSGERMALEVLVSEAINKKLNIPVSVLQTINYLIERSK